MAWSTWSPVRAYPRSCGEFFMAGLERWTRMGLPPLVRGVPARSSPPRVRAGLTPARAGSSAGSPPSAWASRAYPRSCGEFARSCSAMNSVEGLPPLVRGVLLRCRRGLGGHGLTPARAGSSGSCARTAGTAWAYPRSCGEFFGPPTATAVDLGLPPLVRGVRSLGFGRTTSRRLTPARAGSSQLSSERRGR